MKNSGIYKIQSLIKPDRCYIGSGVNIDNRWRVHLCQLRKGIHHSLKLQRHFNKYGESDLVFTIIEPCLPIFLIDKEDTYLHPLPYFNICSKAGSQLGMKRSKEFCKKNRENNGMKGHISPMKDKHHSEEALRKMKKPRSVEAKRNMSIARKGNKNASGKRSEETCKNIGKSKIGKPSPMKGKKMGFIPIGAFKKGHIPWHKDKKTGIIPLTAFKKGNVPWNKELKLKKLAS